MTNKPQLNRAIGTHFIDQFQMCAYQDWSRTFLHVTFRKCFAFVTRRIRVMGKIEEYLYIPAHTLYSLILRGRKEMILSH